jgi:hypothetical protein
MTDRWHRIKEVYQEALVRDPASQMAYLDVVCGDDEDLRREVSQLLKYNAQATRRNSSTMPLST